MLEIGIVGALASSSLAGKFITIYPQGEDQFKQLLEDLYGELKQFEGPYILSDRRYKDCKVLHYRYGGITPLDRITTAGSRVPVIVSPDGHALPDLRTPSFEPPAWVTDPFPSDEVEDEVPVLKDGRYLVTDALSFSNAGGVYSALDTETGQEVVIKEARPHTVFDLLGEDVIKLRKKEWRLLNRLKQTGLAPQPLDLFWEWEHLFLVESFAQGIPIERFAPQYDPIVKIDASEEQLRQYFDKIAIIGCNVARALRVAHDHGIVIGDVSHSNIMVDPSDLNVTLIDLEGAFELGADERASLVTPGFAAKERRTRQIPRFADDYYALGSVLLSLLHPIQAVLDINPRAHTIFLEELEQDYRLPHELVSTILSLMDEVEENRPKPETVEITLADIDMNPQKPPAPADIPADEVTVTLQGISEFILKAATPACHDRLFPADPRMNTPLNVSYGALGVAYALKQLKEEVPNEVMDWIVRHELRPSVYPPSLYVGLSGIAWVLAELGYPEMSIDALDKAKNHDLLFESADLFCGISGFGLASLYFWLRNQEQRFLQQAVQAGEWLLQMKREDERGYCWPSSDGSVLLGYARGSSGTALFLLYLHLATGDDRFLEAGKQALNFDLSFGIVQGEESGPISFPGDMMSNIASPYWYVGSAGVGTTLLRYVAATDDDDLKAKLDRVIPDTCRKYTLFPGLFNGLAGLGNFLLDCYQFLDDERYLREAHNVARGNLLFKIDKASGIAFPGDYLHRISTDLGTGSSGVGLFLHRLLHEVENFNFVLDMLLPTTSRAKNSSFQQREATANRKS
jgi:serine/threonine protein kinase